MTISNTDDPVAGPFEGDDAQTAFPFEFKVFATSDLVVVAVLSDIETLLVLDSDYSVTLNADQDNDPGGTITYPISGSPLTIGDTLTASSNLTFIQTVSIANRAGFYPKVIEQALDRCVMLIKQVWSTVTRSIHFPLSDAGLSGELPVAADRRGRLVGFTDDDIASLTVLAPADGSASSLALLLAGEDGASNIGFRPTATIAATETQAAIEETDSEWRVAVSDADGVSVALDARIDALEVGAGGSLLGKDTKAHLDADLAHAAGTVALVTNDATAANNTYYLKLGGSGAGSWQVSAISPPGTYAETVALLAKGMDSALAVYGDEIVALKVATDRWIVRTPVSGGAPHDYAEYEMFDMGAYMGITHAFALHSIRAEIGGAKTRFMEQHNSAGNVSTCEFAIYAGKLADPFDAGHYAFYGFGHGHMNYNGLSINLDGGGTNYRDLAPVGTILRGTELLFNASFDAKCLDGTVIGTVGVAHIFDADGLRVSHQHVVGTAGMAAQNSYSAMLPATGIDTIKPMGGSAITVGLNDGHQTADFGEVTKFAVYYSDRPTHLLEMSLPNGHPGDPPGDWSLDTTSKTFAIDNTTGIRKLYVNWRSGAAAVAMPVDTYSFLSKYQVRLGAAL